MVISRPFYKWHLSERQTDKQVAVKTPSRAETAANKIVRLFQTHGNTRYAGTRISHTVHMTQCATLAMDTNNDLPLVIGAFMHDIGRLLAQERREEMLESFGVQNYERIGAIYLHNCGFSTRVCAIAEHHAVGLRYMIATDKNYKARLPEEICEELQRKGGEMGEREIAAFERQSFFTDVVQVCQWETTSMKRRNPLVPLSYFHKLILDHLTPTTP